MTPVFIGKYFTLLINQIWCKSNGVFFFLKTGHNLLMITQVVSSISFLEICEALWQKEIGTGQKSKLVFGI